MQLNLDPIWLLAFLLALVRAGAWLAMVPPFNNRSILPSTVLVGVAAGLAILAAPTIAASAVPTTTPGLIGALVLQVLTGAALGLVVNILVSAVTSAGGLVDLFGGINLPPSEDPLSQNQVPLFGQLYEQVAIALLFVTNGEMLLVRGFESSFGSAGLTLASSGNVASILLGDVATFFTSALEIAAPIVAVLFTAQIGLAMLAKAAPQLNVWWLGFPVQAMLSLFLVAIGVKLLPPYIADIVGRAMSDMAGLAK